MFTKRNFSFAAIQAALCLALFGATPAALAGEAERPSAQPLTYLSARTDVAPSNQTTPALEEVRLSSHTQKHGVFSEKQEKLMRDLSSAIDVIPGGVRLCLNITID